MDWDIDEVFLLVGSYYKIKKNHFKNKYKEIVRLSKLLKYRADHLGLIINKTLYYPSTINKRIQNLAYIDTGGKSGVYSYNELDFEIMNLYNNQNEKFVESINRIKNSISMNITQNKNNYANKIYLSNKTYFELFNILSDSCPDINLSRFNLSARTINCFIISKINTLKDLMGYTDERLLDIKNFGVSCLNEVNNKILNKNTINKLLQERQKNNNIPTLPTKSFKVIDSNLKQSYYDIFNISIDNCPDIKLSSFNLSVRTMNCFFTNKIYTLKDLLEYSDEKLLSIRNFGRTSLTEVKIMILNKEVLYKFFSMEQSVTEKLDLVCPSIVKENINAILKKDYTSINEHIFNEDEQIYVDKLIEAIELIDESLILDAYFSPHVISPIINMLYSYYNNFDKRRKLNTEINKLISKIPDERHDTYIINYIKAFSNNEDLISFLTNHNAENINVKDLILLIDEFINDNNIYLKFVLLLKWMSFDINVLVSKFFKELYENKNASLQNTLSLRSQDKTLEYIGNVLGVTRERIRQIESKAQRKFNKWINSCNVVLLISAINNIDDVLTPNNISLEVSDYNKEFLYLLKKCENNNFIYDKELDVFILNSEEIKGKAEEFVDALPDEFSKEKFDKYINDAINNNLSKELVEIIINEQFKHTGSIYHRSNLTRTSAYNSILKKYYPNGMKIYDKDELNNFKQRIYDDYGEIDLPENSRAISARIADLAILCDRGTYAPKREKYISNKLANDIYNYILKNKRSILLTNTIFNVFEERLISEGINNKYFLQGILKELYGHEFMYKRDYILKNDAGGTIYPEVIRYIEEHKYPVSFNEILSEFPGITSIIVSFAVSEPEIVNLFGKYIHISRLNLNTDYKSVLHSTIKRVLSDGEIHHSKELFDIINSHRSDIWRSLFVEYPFGAFSIFEALYGNEFEFKRPYIAKKGLKIERAYERLVEMVNTKDVVEVAEILEFTKENNYIVYNTLDLLNSFNESHLFIDKETLAKINYIGLSEEIGCIVEKNVLNEIGDKDFLPISLFTFTHKLPPIKTEWTDWLLYSIIKKWGKKIEVTVTTNQFRYSTPVVVKTGMIDKAVFKDININYEGLLRKVDDLSNIDDLIEDYLDID